MGFEQESKTPIGIKIKKLGKAFKFKKVFKFGEDEFECPDNFYKLDEDLWSILKTFVIYLERLPEFPISALHDIPVDEKCLELLNDI